MERCTLNRFLYLSWHSIIKIHRNTIHTKGGSPLSSKYFDPLHDIPTLEETAELDTPTNMTGSTLPKPVWSDESFVINLFRGVMQWKHVFPYPEALTPEEEENLKLLLNKYETFLQHTNNSALHDVEIVGKKVINFMHKHGALRTSIPKEYGGLGFNYTQAARFIQLLGKYDLNLANLYSAHHSMGYIGIRLFGNDAQKKKYFKKIVKKHSLSAFALAEQFSASDVTTILTRATSFSDDSYYTINGLKTSVINGTFADFITVFALTESKKKELEITAFIVNKSAGGIKVGAKVPTMGMRGLDQVELIFENVKVPRENIIGKLGDGQRIAMHILNHARFNIAAILSGTMRHIVSTTSYYTMQRKKHGRKINTFGAIQGKLARMAQRQYVTESLAYMIAGNMDRGFMDFYVEAAIAKCYASRAAWAVIDDAMQIHGDAGYLKKTGLERILRDLRWYRIYGGTSDIVRLFISMTGIQHAGIEIEELQLAYRNPSTHLGLIFGGVHRRNVKDDMGYHGMTPSILHLVHPRLCSAAALATQSVTKFGNVVQLLLERYGPAVVDKQFLLIQLANAAIYTYAMVCTLSRCSRSIYNRLPSMDHEVMLTQAFCIETSRNVTKILDPLEANSHIYLGKRLETVTEELIAAGGCVNSAPFGY